MEAILYEMGMTHTEITNAYNNLEEWSKPEVIKTALLHKFSTYSVRSVTLL